MTDKIYKKLPAVLQTTVIKNFFENTVEQLFSKAEIENIRGYIGSQRNDDYDVRGEFLPEPTTTKRFYGLSPTVNTINPETGASENFFFYDELLAALETYGIDTREQNKIFSENYSVYLPPIDVDKFINYAEYYWYPEGPSTIDVQGTVDAPIDIETDVLGQTEFTPSGGKKFRNGMIVQFTGDYVIPQDLTGIEFVVQGVGRNIVLVPKDRNFGTAFSREVDAQGNPTQTINDYIVMERGAVNDNPWSRVNFWYHINNFVDAGDEIPSREFRADRAIIEFDRELELYNYGTQSLGTVDILSTVYRIDEVAGANVNLLIDGEEIVGRTVLFLSEESENVPFIYEASNVSGNIALTRVADETNPPGAQDGDRDFVPVTAVDGDVIQIELGQQGSGLEYAWNGNEWIVPQLKTRFNQAPLFQLYDTDGVALDDEAVYPDSTFAGNKIFGHATEASGDQTVLSTSPDPELGFPLVFRQFKSSSEIVFENFQDTERYEFRAFGGESTTPINGYHYYKLHDDFVGVWRIMDNKTEQRIRSVYDITQSDVDQQRRSFFIGGFPKLDPNNRGGYDIVVHVNGVRREDFQYAATTRAFIDFLNADLEAGDILEIDITATSGLISLSSVSKFDLPVGWTQNQTKQDIATISEPEYLQHFVNYMQEQDGFEGDPLRINNYADTARDPKFASDIIRTNEDILLGAFLLDDQPHNLIDALRFCETEYTKYRNRVRTEINNYYARNYEPDQTKEQILETVLRSVISLKLSKNAFNRTYVIPFGDIFTQEDFTVALNQTQFTLDRYVDLNDLENSMLVYASGEILIPDVDYNIIDFNPITIETTRQLELGSVIHVKIYDAERDSAQCPPTPSTMGLYPLFVPEIVTDTSFKTPIDMIVAHDGSRTPVVGDLRDELLMEYEKRIYSAAKREFRNANSLPEYNLTAIRNGAFRTTGYRLNELENMLRHNFAKWVSANGVDPVVNEFYDEADPFTWNYNPKNDLPGYWKGVYMYYYDTIRPHTNPWEMLGFTEKPDWWDEEYSLFDTDVIGRLIPRLGVYTPENVRMWDDLEHGIIRQGPRENFTDGRYLLVNPFRREGLSKVIPVDNAGELIAPYDLFNTGATSIERVWTNTRSGNDLVANSFLTVNGLQTSFDVNNTYVVGKAVVNHPLDLPFTPTDINYQTYQGERIEEVEVSYAIPRVDLQSNAAPATMSVNNSAAVLINGIPLDSQTNGTSWRDAGEWQYNAYLSEGDATVRDGLLHYNAVLPWVLDQTEWDTDSHSPIVGWSFDGFPIYGPYGYTEYDGNGAVLDANITSIQSSFTLREGTRASGPGGAYTGLFVQDYAYDANIAALPAHTDNFNMRYGVTPDSGGQPIHFYVATIDEQGEPMFPYAVGGTADDTDGAVFARQYYGQPTPIDEIAEIIILDKGGLYSANSFVEITGDGTGAAANVEINELGEIVNVILSNRGRNYTEAHARVIDPGGTGVREKLLVRIDADDNTINRSFVNADATPAIVSTDEIAKTASGGVAVDWQFGDYAPVEQVWRTSEAYPYAVAEALLLAKPGRFATIFGDPTRLYRPAVDKRRLLNRDTNRAWQFGDPDQFTVHGDVNDAGEFQTNVGYTQFINSWLEFQGLTTDDAFTPQLRTLNMKLAHRMSGFIDKDTLVARTDQFSTTGTASSLIIPQENVGTAIHVSPYKSRNYYTGVIIERVQGGYVVRGYDSTLGYFNVAESDTRGPRESVSVGGDPAPFVEWEANKTFKRGTIVQHIGVFYEAPVNITGGDQFDRTLWTRLPSLPQLNAARGVLYQRGTGNINTVEYETFFDNDQDVYNFLVELGRYQELVGYDFGEFDSAINAVRNWAYAAKQFLFWTTGKWEIGNTLSLSPLAPRVKFRAEQGFIAKINRNDREQFCIVDQDGAVIDPKDCEIVREDDYIEIAPLDVNAQIFGTMLFVKEIEHVLSFDNVTNFNDLIYNPTINQRQDRIKLRGQRTSDWKGRFSSSGFIIDGDELLPNLDNLAESLGRYHEFGFIPVQRDLYDSARAMFGFQERDYLRELDLLDDEQVEFYRGLIQNKGTSASLSKIARSDFVADGNITVYDEWALKIGDFGDTDNNQTLEISLDPSEFTQNPQSFTLAFPADTTDVVDRVEILDARFTYLDTPEIEIGPPMLGGEQATAVATLGPDNRLEQITVTNPGSNYDSSVMAQVVVANVLVENSDIVLQKAIADRLPGYISLSNANVSFTLTDNISNTTTSYDVGNATLVTPEQIENAINLTANANVNLSATLLETHNIGGNANAVGYSVILSGSDFTVVDGANIGLVDGNYQPQQRFGVFTTAEQLIVQDAANVANLSVRIDGTLTSNYAYSPGQIVESRDLVTDFGTTLLPDLPAEISYPRSTPTTLGNGDVVYNIANTSATFNFANSNLDANNISSAAIDEFGRYRFVEVYINGERIQNTADTFNWFDTDGDANTSGTSWSNVSGEIFTLSQNSITFNDITQLPKEVLEVKYNPPLDANVDTTDRELFYAITANTEIRVVELGTVQFNENFQGDLPGSNILIRVTALEGIAARLNTVRTFEITPNIKGDDTILIDIDDPESFIKRPTGVRESALWPTFSDGVDASGITDQRYPTVRNAGYVNPSNVNFQAFDLASLPDLYDQEVLIKPSEGDLIHIARAERDDWNVYKLTDIGSGQNFLYRNNQGQVNLYTDRSLFDFLDTNQIGEPGTGRYLDYFLSLKTDRVSDQVVLWTNEDIVNSTQLELADIEAPRMTEARIASIEPAAVIDISNVEPVYGAAITGLSLRTSELFLNDTVLITGVSTGDLAEGDAVQLLDNVGTSFTYTTAFTATAGNMTLVPGQVASITVTDPGTGYTTPPNVTVGASPNADFTATAEAVLNADGNVTQINLTYAGGGYTAAPTVTIEPAVGANTSSATATATFDDGLTEINEVFTEFGAGNILLTLDGQVDPVLLTRAAANIANLSVAERQVISDINNLTNRAYFVDSVNVGTGEIVISNPAFDANLAGNLVNTTYTVVQYDDYTPDDGNIYYIARNVTGTSFEIQRPNTVPADGVSARILNKTRVLSPGHDITSGDIVRIRTNGFAGTYAVETANTDSFVIDAPYTFGFNDGVILKKGIKINTVGEHGITQAYADFGKRISTHFVTPKFYNKVYSIDRVTPTAVFMDNVWPFDDRTYKFYEEKTAYLNVSNVYDPGNVTLANATNVIELHDDFRLTDKIAFYNSNAQIVNPGAITMEGANYAVFDPTALNSDANISVKVTLMRQVIRNDNRYPVLTTVDHNKVNLNGTTVALDGFNNLGGMATSLNRQIDLRRSFIKTDQGDFGIRFAMLNDPRAKIARAGSNGQPQSAAQLGNYGPYIRDPEVINGLSNNQLPVIGTLDIANSDEKRVDPEFNKGPNLVGPVFGLVYFDQRTQTEFRWDPTVQNYKPIRRAGGGVELLESAGVEAVLPPENHVDSPLAETDDGFVNQNPTLILIRVPGNGPANRDFLPGVQQSDYSMSLEVTFQTAGDDVTLPAYRLMPNPNMVFKIYQAVQNDDLDIYYNLVDVSNPPNVPHDFYQTVNSFSDFLDYPTSDFYFTNDVEISLDGNGRITNANDPIRLQNAGRTVELPPVEPAAFLGKQIVPEPFAVEVGNGSNAIGNFVGLPPLTVESSQSGRQAQVTVNEAGYNSFFMWTAGLEPGQWAPTSNGPGALPGSQGSPAAFGYGRGYYTEDDQHLSPNGYPVTGAIAPYDAPKPRFLYNRAFSVFPGVDNTANTFYIDQDGNVVTDQADILAGLENGTVTATTVLPDYVDPTNEDTTVEGLRPEEVFVACFWSEPFTYRNQLTGFNFSNLDSNGTPEPIEEDYVGTVVRVKYIRLTELPPNAVTRRIIPDTGWGGKEWRNIRVDDINFNAGPAQDIWDIFEADSVDSGSTGDPDEGTIGIGTSIPGQGGGGAGTTFGNPVPPTLVAGGVLDGNPFVNPIGEFIEGPRNVETIPVTQVGPVLNAEALEGLPGPCDPLPDPILGSADTGTGSCLSEPSRSNTNGFNRGDLPVVPGTDDQVRYISRKITSEFNLRAFFNSLDVPDGIAVAIYQSTAQFDPTDVTAWTETADPVISTISNGGIAGGQNGDQIAQYGVRPISGTLRRTPTIDGLLRITDNDITDDLFVIGGPVTGENLPMFTPDDIMGAQAAAFLQRTIRCTEGSWFTVLIKDNGVSASAPDWSIVVEYRDLLPEGVDPGANTCTPEELNSPSAAFFAGGRLREWVGDSDNAYFGQVSKPAEEVEYIDNIYFPYDPLPPALGRLQEVRNLPIRYTDSRIFNDDPNRVASGPGITLNRDVSVTTFDRWQFPAGKFSTLEIKGYFLAPQTGIYTFSAEADDGLWMWISSERVKKGTDNDSNNTRIGKSDLSGDEYFKDDGFPAGGFPSGGGSRLPYLDLKRYHRDNAVLRVGGRTTGSDDVDPSIPGAESFPVTLVRGQYYFVRVIAGNFNTGSNDRGTINNFRWTCQTFGINLDREDFEVPVNTATGIGVVNFGFFNGIPDGGVGIQSDFMKFSGRSCINSDGVPPAQSNDAQGNTPPPAPPTANSPPSQVDPRRQALEDCANRAGVGLVWGRVRPPQAYIDCYVSAYGTCPGSVPNCNSTSSAAEPDTPVFSPATPPEAPAPSLDTGNGGSLSLGGLPDNFEPTSNPVSQPAPPTNNPVVEDTSGGGNFAFDPSLLNDFDLGFLPGGGLNAFGQANRGRLNYSGYSQNLLTGYNFFPQSFKVQPRQISRPEQFGYSVNVQPGRFVSATNQVISGGGSVPLAEQLRPVSGSRSLSNTPIVDEPWAGNLQGVNSLNQTVRFQPRRVSSAFNADGVAINNSNVTRRQISSNGITGPAFQEPGTQTPPTGNPVNPGDNNPAFEPPEFTRFDRESIRFNRTPYIDITPKTFNANGVLEAAGPTARAYIRQPTPSVTLNQEDLIGIPPNSEILLNGRRITVRGRSFEDIKTQVNCSNLGIRAILNTAQTGQTLTLSSCDGKAWRASEGCAGGRYKQVGDFHINRGFEQAVNTTTGVTQQYVFGNGVEEDLTIPRYVAIDDELGQAVFDSSVENPENRLSLIGDPRDNPAARVSLRVPSIAPVYSNTRTTSSTTGGSGYRVGDRLRLLGGTPVENTKGPLTKICIDSAGSGYTNPANITVVINSDGNTPGIGASAVVTELDINGGIAGIEMTNTGAGFDFDRPPKVEIVDRSPPQIVPVQINAAWPEKVDVATGQTVEVTFESSEIDSSGNPNAQRTRRSRFLRATAPVQFSDASRETDTTVANTSIAWVDPTTVSGINSPLAEIQVDTTASGPLNGWIRPNSFVEIEYTPVDGTPQTNLFWIPQPGENDPTIFDNKFYIESSSFTSEDNVAAVFGGAATVTVRARAPWWDTYVLGQSSGRASLVDTVNPSIQKVPAELSAKIALNPNPNLNGDPQDLTSDDVFADGYESFAGPLRVAKFIVTDVDAQGAITSLRVIDRGLYKIFPSDLTFGIPLEYDYANQGQGLVNPRTGTISSSQRNKILGVGDPTQDGNAPYGTKENDQYGVPPFRAEGEPESDPASFKHPDWKPYPEFYYDGQNFVPYTGSPGAYDPSTFVIVDTNRGTLDPNVANSRGFLLQKSYEPIFDVESNDYGRFKIPQESPGGTGARLFITAQEVPDCTERGTAKGALGIPDQVVDVNAPQSLIGDLNNALSAAGYNPDEVTFAVTPVGDVSVVDLETAFPAVNLDGTPGFLEALGLPVGDYNVAGLCIQGVLNDVVRTEAQAQETVDRIFDENPDLGVIDERRVAEITGRPLESLPPTRVLSLLCVENIITDNNSVFGDSIVRPVRELFKYDLTNVFGDQLTLNTDAKKEITPVTVFESRRFNANNPVVDLDGKAWIDDYENSGWAYLHNGEVRRRQEPLVDTEFVYESLVYDADTGERVRNLTLWDPFKGILPGFVRNELDFISDEDPVSYNESRTNFGRNNIGKVWWDTSTVRYNWYEQGSNSERARNWGRAFPGSSITVCEWVESKSRPENWNGNGVPRWTNRYITERHQDPVSGQYELYYYYWVQNRSVVDDRVKRDMGRELDTQTVARYIANPVGYGLEMAAYVNQDSFLLYNTRELLNDADTNLQIRFSRNMNPNGIDHAAWQLVREGDDSSRIPDILGDKMIDSLAGENAVGQIVPDPTLSSVEKLGTQFRPRQTMFANVKEARRVMASFVNEVLAGTKLNTQFPQWDAELPDTLQYLEITDWYAADRVDARTNRVIRYDDSRKPVYKVSNTAELNQLQGLPDETVVQVQSNKTEEPQLWMYEANDSTYTQISIANETVRFKDSVFKDDYNIAMATEIRVLLESLRDNVLVTSSVWNDLFFEMIKYAYVEQGQLDWAFKSTYLFIEKQERDLQQFAGFSPDNFDRILEYMNEVKPYNAKIREYKDGKTADRELIGRGSIGDADKPPYVDPINGETRILDENSVADQLILSTNPDYTDYYTAFTSGETGLIRKTNTTLVFDRTNFEFTQQDWDRTQVEVERSIAQNIANITQVDPRAFTYLGKFRTVESNVEIGNTAISIDNLEGIYVGHEVDFLVDNVDVVTGKVETVDAGNNLVVLNTEVANVITAGSTVRFHTDYVRAIDRIFKYDPVVQQSFALEVNRYFDDATAATNNEIIGNADVMSDIVFNNGLDGTLELLRQKVGGGFRGTLLDGGIFNQFVNNQDFIANAPTEFSYSINPYDTEPLNTITSTEGYQGTFTNETQLEQDGVIYDGFSGTPFQKVLYGSNRPEELALLSPRENLIMTVHTSKYSYGSNSEFVAGNVELGNIDLNSIPSIPTGKDVKFRTHYTVFGVTDYWRVQVTTELTADLTRFDEIMEVSDTIEFAPANPQDPEFVWVNDEKIGYNRKEDGKFVQITRGVDGTTIQDHPAGSVVWSAATRESFNGLSPEQNVWLDVGTVYSNKDRWDFFDRWDEIANANVIVTQSNANITAANISPGLGLENELFEANVTDIANANLTVGEGVLISSTADVTLGNVDAVVTNVNLVTGIAEFRIFGDSGSFDTDIPAVIGLGNAGVGNTIVISSIQYPSEQNQDFAWDAASVFANTAISLADIDNVNLNSPTSIMRFLHDLPSFVGNVDPRGG